MTKQYIQPQVQVMELQSMVVMQAASPAGNNMHINMGIPTDVQW